MPLLPQTRLLLARKAIDLLQPIRGTSAGRALLEELEEEIHILRVYEKDGDTHYEDGPLLRFKVKNSPLGEYGASSPHSTYRPRDRRSHGTPRSEPDEGRHAGTCAAEPALRDPLLMTFGDVENGDGPATDVREACYGGEDRAALTTGRSNGNGVGIQQADPFSDTAQNQSNKECHHHDHRQRDPRHRGHSRHHSSHQPQKSPSSSPPKFSWRKGLLSYVEALVKHEVEKRVHAQTCSDGATLDPPSSHHDRRASHRRREDGRSTHVSASSSPSDRDDRHGSGRSRRSRKGKEPARSMSPHSLRVSQPHGPGAAEERSRAVPDAWKDSQAISPSPREPLTTTESVSDWEGESDGRGGNEAVTDDEGEVSRGDGGSTAAELGASGPSPRIQEGKRTRVTKAQRRRLYGLSRAEIRKESMWAGKDCRDREGEREAWGGGMLCKGKKEAIDSKCFFA